MVFLTDYRHGSIGRISLETPSSRQTLLEKEPLIKSVSEALSEPNADSEI
jgi:hypothetical protein